MTVCDLKDFKADHTFPQLPRVEAKVLGAGMVGTTIAWDLSRMGYDVTVNK